jgi:hypothetical protein
MSTEPMYVAAAVLDEYFVDQITGLPMAGGTLNFYQDNSRATPKDVFVISGSPGSYTYVSIGNVVTLNATGNPADESGNNIVIYYYPFDPDGNVQLYYVEVINSNDVPQFTREAWPPGVSQANPEPAPQDLENFIPNGQFLSHVNVPIPAFSKNLSGQITAATTQIAQGGWSFQRPITSGATDLVTFFRYGSYVTNPTTSPRYAVQVQTLAADPSDSFKYISVKFDDVNKFASDSQFYTFGFNAVTVASANFNVNVAIVKNFGTGGSSTTTTVIGSPFLVTATQTLNQISFVFGNNTGKTIGNLDDDSVSIVLQLPTSISFTGQFTDFFLTSGDVTLTDYPTQTNKDMIARSLVPPTPLSNGLNLGLPIILTQYGLDFDSSGVGLISACSTLTAPRGFLICDGKSYPSSGYDSFGVPYSRLFNLLKAYATFYNQLPIFGTGYSYVNSSFGGTGTSSLYFSTNIAGTQTPTADGASPTGFTFTTVATGQTSSSVYSLNGFVYGNGSKVWLASTIVGVATGTNNNGTSGALTFTDASNVNSGSGTIAGSAVSKQVLSITVNSIPAGGTSLRIQTPTVGQTYIWFTLDGVGVDPGYTGPGIQVNLLSTMAVHDVAYAIANAVSGFQVSTMRCLAGSSIPNSSYFTFTAGGNLYYVWYSLNNTGTDPAVLGGIGIKVIYFSSSTANNIAQGTSFVINSIYFGTPDLRGAYLKGYDPTGLIDANVGFRYTTAGDTTVPLSVLPGLIGTTQFGVNLAHSHDLLNNTITGGAPPTLTPSTNNNPPTANLLSQALSMGTGGNDTYNVAVNWVIKY